MNYTAQCVPLYECPNVTERHTGYMCPSLVFDKSLPISRLYGHRCVVPQESPPPPQLSSRHSALTHPHFSGAGKVQSRRFFRETSGVTTDATNPNCSITNGRFWTCLPFLHITATEDIFTWRPFSSDITLSVGGSNVALLRSRLPVSPINVGNLVKVRREVRPSFKEKQHI